MEKLKNSKLMVLFVLVFAFFVYEKFAKPSSSAEQVDVVVDSSVMLIGNEFLDYLAKVKAIEVDDSLFKSTAWSNLIDFSKPLPEVSPGKDNLFDTPALPQISPVVPTKKSR